MIGYIYKIYDNTNGNVYYGSTNRNISQRINEHKYQYNKFLKGERAHCKSYEILKNNDYCYYIVEEVKYENKWELLSKERFYIENNICVNKYRPIINKEEKIQKQKENNSEYYKNNKEKLKTEAKKYRDDNSDKMKEKIECECGKIISREYFRKHIKTKFHIKFIENKICQ